MALNFGAATPFAGNVLHRHGTLAGTHCHGEPSTAFSFTVPARCACEVAVSITQSSSPVAGAVACATNAACFESGDHIASTAFNFAGRPVIVFGAVASTACSRSATSYRSTLGPFDEGLNRIPARRYRGCATSAIVGNVAGCSTTIILASGESSPIGVAGASSSASIGAGGF